MSIITIINIPFCTLALLLKYFVVVLSLCIETHTLTVSVSRAIYRSWTPRTTPRSSTTHTPGRRLISTDALTQKNRKSFKMAGT